MAAGVSEQVPDVVAPPPGNRRFPLVDGLRAIAVLCIVAVHVGTESVNAGTVAGRLLLHLNIGVALFFLISGFLLYRPFIAHRIGGPRPPAIRDYARRRLLRILPAYWLVLIAVIVLPSVAANNDGSWLEQAALVFTLSDSKGWVCIDCGLTQTWSLGVEMTFYLALPFYALLAERIARGRATGEWLRIELILLVAFSAGTAAVQFIHYDAFLRPGWAAQRSGTRPGSRWEWGSRSSPWRERSEARAVPRRCAQARSGRRRSPSTSASPPGCPTRRSSSMRTRSPSRSRSSG